MSKGYIVTVYFSILDPNVFAEYAKLAVLALHAAGGVFLVRSSAVEAQEKGLKERVVIVEFESLERAIAARNSPAYLAALKVLGNAAIRDMRIVEGVPVA